MPLYDGVVSVNDGDIGVILDVAEDRIRLSAGGSEIGEWGAEECVIELVEDGVYRITAENESLRFVPNQPSLFAQAVGADEFESHAPARIVQELGSDQRTPDEGRMTRILIWAAAIVAGFLGIWALASLL